MNIKEIFDDEKWIGSYDSTYQHSDGHTAEVLYSAHNYSIERLEQAVADHVSYMEEQLEAYRHANGSKSDRIQKMKEQYEEAARSWKQHITELEGQVEFWKEHHKTALDKWTLEAQTVKDLEQRIAELEVQVPKVVTPKNGFCDCGNYCMHNCERTSTCSNCGSKLKWEEV